MKTAYNTDQPMLERLLEFINLIRPPGQTKQWLARHFDCSTKTIGRYEKTLEAAGFLIEMDERKRLYLIEPLVGGITIRLMPEEVELVYDLISGNAPDHRLAPPLLAKLLFQTEMGSRVKNKFRSALPSVIQSLSEAIRFNRQISISQYEAAITGQVRERRLQPLNFTQNFNYLVAYEESEGLRVNLKIDRILKVEVLNEPCTVSPDVEVDIFQMAANHERHEVSLLLSHLSRRLLIEQLPDTVKHLSASGNDKFPYRFKATLFSFLPVGRFYLGLPGHVVVEQPLAFKEYLRNRVNDFIL